MSEFSWLRRFDAQDIQEFIDELLAAISDETTGSLDEAIAAWKVTAREIEDPLRRNILTREHSAADFEEAPRPVRVAFL